MLRLASRLSKLLGPAFSGRPRKARARPGRRFACESLEPRELLSGLGTDYTLMGGQWDNSRTITYSIAPDGVSWGGGTNNVNATLNAEYGGKGWQKLVAEALQAWAAVTNLNFVQVSDGPYAFNAPGVNQGDPDFGDIRIGGYNFGTTATIAQTYGPPPNGQTGAGDVELNTGFNFAPGSHYDLESVLIHELGHALGLGESPQPSSLMYNDYEGARTTLSPYDIEGIQSLYGVRSADVYQAVGVATSPSTALNLTPIVNAAGQGQLSGLSLRSVGDVEYFSVVSPNTVGATLSIAAVTQGLSELSPKLSVIDPSTGATLAVNANPGAYNDLAFDSVAGVQPNHRYLIAVTGATGDAFSIGSYGIQLAFSGGTPVAPAPDAYPYNEPFAAATELGTNTQPAIANLTLPSPLNYQLFAFETTAAGPVWIATQGAWVVVGNSSLRAVNQGQGLVGFLSTGPGRYYLILESPNGAPVSNYAFAVRTPVAAASTFTPAAIAAPASASSPLSTAVQVASTSASTAVAPPTPSARKPARPAQ